MPSPLDKIRRNSPLATVARLASEHAEQLHKRYGKAAGIGGQETSCEDAPLLFDHWHDVAKIAYHLRRLANK